MDSFRNIFKRYASDPTFLASPKPIKSELRTALAAQLRINRKRYAVVFAVALVLVLIIIGILIHDTVTGAKQYPILAAAGLGIPVVLTALWRIGREWNQSDLMLLLIANSDEATVRGIVRVMVQDYYAPRSDSGDKVVSNTTK